MKKILALLLIVFSLWQIVNAQSQDETIIELTALRDSFVNDIQSFGYKPSLPLPELILDNPVSFGNYDDSSNTLHTTTSWKDAPDEVKQFFNGAVKSMDSTETGEVFFNKATHKWIFIHEFGHWWRACQKQKVSHYDEEMGANRIAVAYWREKDTSFMNWQLNVFENFVSHFPNPVPAGISKEKYLNDNYETIGASPAYTWYQAQMIVAAYYEKPVMTFKKSIETSGNFSYK